MARRVAPAPWVGPWWRVGLIHEALSRRRKRVNVPRASSANDALGGPLAVGCGIDLLPGKRVLIPEFGRDRVAEYAADGTLLWQAAVEKPTSVQRLADGRTLTCSSSTGQLVELNRRGRVARLVALDPSPHRATRR